jgi:two-component system, cell cycle response regulator DivK
MGDLHDITVMIVDDKDTNAWVVRKMLERIGVGSVVICDSGDDARAMVLKLPRIDLVLLDLRLPDENGYEIYESLKSHPALSETHFVAATAHVLPSEMKRTQDFGFDGFISKPFRLYKLRDQIQTILEGKPVWEPG